MPTQGSMSTSNCDDNFPESRFLHDGEFAYTDGLLEDDGFLHDHRVIKC
jgi:hypothetical protein